MIPTSRSALPQPPHVGCVRQPTTSAAPDAWYRKIPAGFRTLRYTTLPAFFRKPQRSNPPPPELWDTTGVQPISKPALPPKEQRPAATVPPVSELWLGRVAGGAAGEGFVAAPPPPSATSMCPSHSAKLMGLPPARS